MNIEIKELRRYIEKIATNVLKDETFKTVFSGAIKSSIPGGYEVQLVNAQESSLVLAESLYEDKTYNVNDMVYLVQAESNRGDDYDTKYFIMGLVSKIEQNYANLSDLERFQFLGDRQILTGFDPVQWPHLINDEENASFLNAFRANGAILFSANITSDFTNTANPVNFGFKFTFTFDNDEQDSVYFLQGEFVGQPWHQNNVTQKKLINLGKGNKTKSILMELVGPEEGGFSATNVSLEIGTLLDVAKDFSVSINTASGKNYFNKSVQPDNENKTIKIKASVKFKQQPLDTSLIKYYWFVEDDRITAESFPMTDNKYGYNALGGEGWACLNDWVHAEYYNGETMRIETDCKTIIYTTDDSELEVDRKWLTKYENKIKCVIGYNLANAESEPIKIYNFDHEDFDAVLKLDEETELPLLFLDETATLTATFTSKLVGIKSSDLVYKWYLDDDDNSLKYQTIETNEEGKEETKDCEYSDNSLTIGYPEKSTKNCYKLEKKEGVFYCKVFRKEDLDNSIAETNEIKVWSEISESNSLIETYYYQYWIDSASSVSFIQQNVEQESDKGFDTTYVYYKVGEDHLTPIEDKVNDEALNWLKTSGPFEDCDNNNYYLYYTSQRQVSDAITGVVLRYDDYFYPQVLRYVAKSSKDSVLDLLTIAGVEQLNSFNRLTDNGKSQGIYYEGEEYSLTNDTQPKEEKLKTGKGYYKKVDTFEYKKVDISGFEEGKEYYIKDENDSYIKADSYQDGVKYYIKELVKTTYVLRDQNSDNYDIDEISNKPSEFLDGEEYYEITAGGDLYINASFIRSGHLEVSDGDKNTVFRATLNAEKDVPPVIMAGYQVNNTTLQTQDGNVGMGSSKEEYAFWAGKQEEGERPFSVTHDGKMKARNGEFNGRVYLFNKDKQTITIDPEHIEAGVIIKTQAENQKEGKTEETVELSKGGIGFKKNKNFIGGFYMQPMKEDQKINSLTDWMAIAPNLTEKSEEAVSKGLLRNRDDGTTIDWFIGSLGHSSTVHPIPGIFAYEYTNTLSDNNMIIIGKNAIYTAYSSANINGNANGLTNITTIAESGHGFNTIFSVIATPRLKGDLSFQTDDGFGIVEAGNLIIGARWTPYSADIGLSNPKEKKSVDGPIAYAAADATVGENHSNYGVIITIFGV